MLYVQASNLLLLCLLAIFIFGVLGMKMCGSAPAPAHGAYLNDMDNFGDIWSSMMLLFQASQPATALACLTHAGTMA